MGHPVYLGGHRWGTSVKEDVETLLLLNQRWYAITLSPNTLIYTLRKRFV